MAKRWYPVIDLLSCAECGRCVSFCSHGVYDRARSPVPVVIHPDGCVDHCHGCGNRCPQGAISYVGDDTGWTPPARQANDGRQGDCGCACGAGDEQGARRKLLLEYLALDRRACDRCAQTEAALDEVVAVLRPALELAGYAVAYQKREVATPQLAEEYRFLSSPTIRVNGQDVFGPVQESGCSCCGEIAGAPVDCRVFEDGGKTYEVPTKEMLAHAILKSLSAQPSCSCGWYEFPDNLRRFYEGKARKAEQAPPCCGGEEAP